MNYTKGDVLMFIDFQKMRPGDKIFIEHEDINGIATIGDYDPDSDSYILELDDEILEFTQMGPYNGPCFDDVFGEGETRLFHVKK